MSVVKPEVAAGLELLARGAGLAPAEDRGVLSLRGEDRASFLQGMLSNDVASLAPGAGCHALLLSDQARIVAELRALALEEEVWLEAARERIGELRAALDRYVVADDVEIEERPHRAVALRGERAAAIVCRAAGRPELADLAECGHARAEIGGVALRLERVRDLGVDGYLLWAEDAAGLAVVREALAREGAEPVAAAALEARRLEAGLAREGVDFGPGTLAAEVPSLGRAISFRKGCYLGQEVLERVAARGRVRWLVVGLEAEGPLSPGEGVTRDGSEVGRVSSAAALARGRFVAMARLRAEAATPGAELAVGATRARVRDYAPLA